MNRFSLLAIAGLLIAAVGWPASGLTADSATAEIGPLVVTGVGAIVNGNKVAAKAAAIEDALRKAITERMGANVQSTRIVENYVLKMDRITSTSEGAITRYEVLSEKDVDGTVEVRVAVHFMKDLLRALQLDHIRVALYVNELRNAHGEYTPSTAFSSRLEEILLRDGIRLQVNATRDFQAAAERARRAGPSAPGDRTGAVFGTLSNADVWLVLDVKIEETQNLKGWVRYTASAEQMKALLFTSDEPIMSGSRKVKGMRSFDADTAAEDAAGKLAEQVAAAFVNALRARYDTLAVRRLAVRGVTDTFHTDKLRTGLLARDGVRDVRLTYFDATLGIALLEVTMNTDASGKFAEYLQFISGIDPNVRHMENGWYAVQVLQ